MKKCPKCEVNWIKDDEELCEVCLQDRLLAETQFHKTKPYVHFGECFTFKSDKYLYDGKRGFKAYNSKGEFVGIVFMTNDERTPAYKHCELHCFPKYHSRYGEWHRIKSLGDRVSWKVLCDELNTKGEYSCYIDD